MEFENTFLVQAPVPEVWDLLLDVERIAPCMPGAQVLEQTGDDAYKVAVKVRLGPMTMNYKGDVEIVAKDGEAHRATMRAKAKEARGQGTATAEIVMALSEQPGGTRASILTTMSMSGKAAAMGQGVIKDVAAALTDTFAQNLAGLVDAGHVPAGAPAEAQAAAATGAPLAAQDTTPPLAAAAPPPPAASASAEASLPVGKIAAAVVVGRLKDPRTYAVLAAVLLLVRLLRGRRD